MSEHSDEYWESQGFKKIFIPALNAWGWAKEMDSRMEISECTSVFELEVLLELSVAEENFEQAAEIRDRIEELKKAE